MNTAEAIKAAREALENSNGILQYIGGDSYDQAQAQVAENEAAISALSAASAEQQPEGQWVSDKEYWEAPQASQPSDNYHDAYRGAREEMEIWKKRALEAEESSRRLVAAINEENGPTHMGEPAIRTSQPSAWNEAIEAAIDSVESVNSQCDAQDSALLAAANAIRALRQQAPAVKEQHKDYCQGCCKVHTGVDCSPEDMAATDARLIGDRQRWQKLDFDYNDKDNIRTFHVEAYDAGLAAASHPAPAQTGEKTK